MSEFHHTKSDASGTPLSAGDVLRVFDGPFGDAVILGFDPTGHAKLSRPYVYAHGVGTTCATPLLGTENYEMSPGGLKAVLAQWPRRATERVT